MVAAFDAAACVRQLAHVPPYENQFQLVQGDMVVGLLEGISLMKSLTVWALITCRVLLHTIIAAEIAAARADVKGPGTFLAA